MKIKFDQNGVILGIGEILGATEIPGDVSEDFFMTFSLGKYSVKDNLIVEDLHFVLPEPPDMPV